MPWSFGTSAPPAALQTGPAPGSSSDQHDQVPTSPEAYPTTLSGFLWEFLGLSTPNIGVVDTELGRAFGEYEETGEQEPRSSNDVHKGMTRSRECQSISSLEDGNTNADHGLIVQKNDPTNNASSDSTVQTAAPQSLRLPPPPSVIDSIESPIKLNSNAREIPISTPVASVPESHTVTLTSSLRAQLALDNYLNKYQPLSPTSPVKDESEHVNDMEADSDFEDTLNTQVSRSAEDDAVLHQDAELEDTSYEYVPPVEDSFHEDPFAYPPIRLLNREENVPAVVTTSIAESLRPALPALQRESSWYLLYSLDQHGISLNTLYTFCTEANTVDPTNGCLLAIKSEKGAIFGAFSNEGLHLSKGHYFGNQNCFLWRYEVGTSDTIADAGVRVWPPTGLNTYFVLCEPGEIAFGGGGDGFGLWLDGELYNGHSGVCETFGNECLNESGSESDSNSQSRRKGEFIVAGLEVWGFSL